MNDDLKKLFEQTTGDRYERFLYHTRERQFKGIDLHKKKILDIGCGKGLIDLYFSLQYPDAEIFCLDPDEGRGAEKGNLYFLRQQIERFNIKNITIVNKDFYKNGLDDNEFDVIIAYHSFHHIVEEELKPSRDEGNLGRWVNQVNEVYRLLKPGGTFILREISSFNFWNHTKLKWYLGQVEWQIHPTLKDFKHVINHSKFKTYKSEYEISYKLKKLSLILQNNVIYGYFLNPNLLLFMTK